MTETRDDAFLERHFQIDPDPLKELVRRSQLWASSPPSNGVGLHAAIVPDVTVQAAIREITRLRSQRVAVPEAVAFCEIIDGKVVSVRLDKSRHCTVPLFAHQPAQDGWQDISTAPTEAPDWLWYGEMDDGFPLITFGRWRKHGCQSGYIKTDADDFNSKNDPKYALSAERARVIEECASIPATLAENGQQILLHMGELTAQELRSVKAILRHIAAAIRALAHGGSNDR